MTITHERRYWTVAFVVWADANAPQGHHATKAKSLAPHVGKHAQNTQET
jgi:hypothetical protein